MTFARSQHARIKKVGICATESGRRFMCNSCGATFSEGRSMPPGGRSFDFGKPVQAMSRLVTGRSDYSPSWRKPRRQWSPRRKLNNPMVLFVPTRLVVTAEHQRTGA